MDRMSHIKIFLDCGATIDLLSDNEAGRLLKALMHYGISAEAEELPGQEKLVFAMLKAQIDRDNAEYAAYLAKQRERGERGGRPKTTGFSERAEKTTGFSERNKKTTGFSERTEKTLYTDTDTDIYTDTDTEEVSHPKGANTRARARFTPPTVDEVRAYCTDSGYRIDAEHFVAYYESNGWRVGKNPMKDWRAAVRTWVRNGYEAGGKASSAQKKVYTDELPWTEG